MIYTDLPIQSIEEDELNRVEFTKNLGNLINNYKKEECLVLSLMGEWGSGKTSLINLILNELSKNIIIRFDPWLFPEHEKLVLHFFNELSSHITFKDNSRQKCFRKNLKKLVNSLTLSASLTIPLPLIGLTLSVTKHSDNTSSYESLEKLKEDIDKDLDSLDSKIIIVIDNIDRLNKSEVKEIFQLVKSLADFKNIIYILSFDKKVVLESLDSYVSSPEIFLEKIIQIPIDVPKIEKYKLQEYFQNKLKKLLDTKEIFNNEEIRTISYLSVFIENIRDIKRYLNNLNFYLDVVKSEVNIEDYLLISALQVFENQIYLDIRSNKKLFADDLYHDNEKTKKDIDEIIKRRKKVNENTIKRILCKLFPKINYVYNNILDPDYSSWESNLKIASPKFFNKYFTLNIPENEIRTTELNYIIDSNDYKSLENNILEIEQPEKIIDLLEKLSNECLDIPQEKIPLFIEF